MRALTYFSFSPLKQPLFRLLKFEKEHPERLPRQP